MPSILRSLGSLAAQATRSAFDRRRDAARDALEERIDRATPEGLRIVPGREMALRYIDDKQLRSIGREADAVDGNNKGGVDIDELATYRRRWQGKLDSLEVVIKDTSPDSALYGKLSEVRAFCQEQLNGASTLSQIIAMRRGSTLRELAGSVVRDGRDLATGVSDDVVDRMADGVASGIRGGLSRGRAG